MGLAKSAGVYAERNENDGITMGPYVVDPTTARVEITMENDKVAATVGKNGYFAMKRLSLIVHRHSDEYGSGDAAIAEVYMRTQVGQRKGPWMAESNYDTIITDAPLPQALVAATSYLMQVMNDL